LQLCYPESRERIRSEFSVDFHLRHDVAQMDFSDFFQQLRPEDAGACNLSPTFRRGIVRVRNDHMG